MLSPAHRADPNAAAAAAIASRWHALADDVLGGRAVTPDEALAMLGAPAVETLDIVAAAYRLRYRHFGNVVKLNYLVNAQSGLCPEDCHYCSQSRVSSAPIAKYKMRDSADIVAEAERAVALGASTCCIVASGRTPSARELAKVCDAVRAVKARYPTLKICACLGSLDRDQLTDLGRAGVQRINHNLNTSRDHHPAICTTHTYDDRLATLRAVKEAGLSPCAGGIAGMGETDQDNVELAFALRELDVDSIPVNFLHAIDGTPLEGRQHGLTPERCLRILCMFRFVHPDREVRVSGGREVHLRSLQPLALYPANAMFVADYLTTPGQDASLDARMIEDLGFTVEPIPIVEHDAAATTPPTTGHATPATPPPG